MKDKKFTFEIYEWEQENFFFRLDCKQDIVKLLMTSIKKIIHNRESKKKVIGKMTIITANMNRIFYFSENKYFSIVFPFSIIFNKDESLNVNYVHSELTSDQYSLNFDSKTISNVLELSNNSEVSIGLNAIDFVSAIERVVGSDERYLPLLLDLFRSEDGYIRYDDDEVGGLGKDNHPQHHYDIFYSNHSTFKIGLQKEIDNDTLIELIDKNKKCHFIVE